MKPPKPLKEVTPEKVKSLFLNRLARAPQTRAGLVSYSIKKEIPAEVFEPILDRFEEVGLINDAEYAAMWVRSRRNIRGSGPAALKRELAQKGIAPDLIEIAVAERQGDDFEVAFDLATKKLKSLGRYPLEKQQQRLLDFLVRRGYSFSIAWRCLSELRLADQETD
jgi:regulatory protein